MAYPTHFFSVPTPGINNEHSLTFSWLKIQQHRVRASLRRVDPEGSTSRWMAAVHQRTYSVKGPNSFWNIDGYHKLVR